MVRNDKNPPVLENLGKGCQQLGCGLMGCGCLLTLAAAAVIFLIAILGA